MAEPYFEADGWYTAGTMNFSGSNSLVTLNEGNSSGHVSNVTGVLRIAHQAAYWRVESDITLTFQSESLFTERYHSVGMGVSDLGGTTFWSDPGTGVERATKLFMTSSFTIREGTVGFGNTDGGWGITSSIGNFAQCSLDATPYWMTADKRNFLSVPTANVKNVAEFETESDKFYLVYLAFDVLDSYSTLLNYQWDYEDADDFMFGRPWVTVLPGGGTVTLTKLANK
jgi:hypothetical protein